MIYGRKVTLVLPAYQAAATLEKTIRDVPIGVVDEFILVDDASSDETIEVGKKLGLKTFRHPENRGYGGNQKTCYNLALASGADIIVMLHPDYQYEPKLVPVMAHMIASGVYDVVLGSRILGNGALKGGMPLYKYVSNRVLTAIENILIGQKLSEYHTGYRAFSRETLQAVSWESNSEDFIFDNQILVQFEMQGFRFGEVSCPTKYSPESSSIGFQRSAQYGLGVLWTAIQFRLHKWGWVHFKMFATKKSDAFS